MVGTTGDGGRAVCAGGGPLRVAGCWRRGVENAASAIWLLAPRTRKDRIQRRLRVALEDAKHATTAAQLIGDPPIALREMKADIQAVATRAGVAITGMGNLTTQSVIQDAGASFAMGANEAEFTWRALSAAAHGETWAIKSLPTHEVLGDPSGPIVTTRVTLDIVQIRFWAQRAMLLLDQAERLYAVRSGRHHN